MEGSSITRIIDLCGHMKSCGPIRNQIAEYNVSVQIFIKLTDQNKHLHRQRTFLHKGKKPRCFISGRDADFLCEIHTTPDAKKFLCHKFALPSWLLSNMRHCVYITCLPAQIDDSSDTRPFHIDVKGQGSQTKLYLQFIMCHVHVCICDTL